MIATCTQCGFQVPIGGSDPHGIAIMHEHLKEHEKENAREQEVQ